MSLSIDKLSELLKEKNLTIKDLYVYDEELKFAKNRRVNFKVR